MIKNECRYPSKRFGTKKFYRIPYGVCHGISNPAYNPGPIDREEVIKMDKPDFDSAIEEWVAWVRQDKAKYMKTYNKRTFMDVNKLMVAGLSRHKAELVKVVIEEDIDLTK